MDTDSVHFDLRRRNATFFFLRRKAFEKANGLNGPQYIFGAVNGPSSYSDGGALTPLNS